MSNNPINLNDPSGLCGEGGRQSINCNTLLPNGQTVGDVVRRERAVLEQALDSALQADQTGSEADPLAAETGALIAIAWPNGPIDFKNNFQGQGDPKFLADEGNFAFYAVGSGFLPNKTLDALAGTYALLTAIFGSRHFSDLTGSMFSDSSAARVRDMALASNGCSP